MCDLFSSFFLFPAMPLCCLRLVSVCCLCVIPGNVFVLSKTCFRLLSICCFRLLSICCFRLLSCCCSWLCLCPRFFFRLLSYCCSQQCTSICDVHDFFRLLYLCCFRIYFCVTLDLYPSFALIYVVPGMFCPRVSPSFTLRSHILWLCCQWVH